MRTESQMKLDHANDQQRVAQRVEQISKRYAIASMVKIDYVNRTLRAQAQQQRPVAQQQTQR